MTINEAAESVASELRGQPWLVAVGVGVDVNDRPAVYVYTTGRLKPRDAQTIPHTRGGFWVMTRSSGRPKPAELPRRVVIDRDAGLVTETRVEQSGEGGTVEFLGMSIPVAGKWEMTLSKTRRLPPKGER